MLPGAWWTDAAIWLWCQCLQQACSMQHPASPSFIVLNPSTIHLLQFISPDEVPAVCHAVVPELRDVRTVLFAVNSAESADTTRAGMHWSAGVLQRGVQPGVVHAVHADSTAEALNENHFMACVLPGMVALVRAAGWLDSAPGQPACVVHTSCLQAPLQPSGNDCGPCACATLCAWAAAAVRGSGTDLREVELTPPDVRGMRMSLYQLAQSMREHTTAIASAALLPGLVDDDMPLE